jgi:1-deoxy-D-xylulose-5-phosphate reductoisomerase
MEFYTACTDKFPCLSMAYHALRRGGNVPCVLNAANEIAVEAFLSEQIRFTAIPKIISGTLERVDVVSNPSFSQLEETHTEARRVAQHLLLSC